MKKKVYKKEAEEFVEMKKEWKVSQTNISPSKLNREFNIDATRK